MKVLIANLLRLGDVIISLPLAKNLKLNFDKTTISYLVKENIKDIFKCVPYVDKVYSYKNKLSLLSNFKEFKTFDSVIFVMEKDILRLKIFSSFRIKRRIGFSLSTKSKNYLTDMIDLDEKFEGMEKLFLRLLKPFRIPNLSDNNIPELYPLEEDLKFFESILPKNTKKIVVHTDTYASSRKWLYFNELIEKILKEIDKDIFIILTGKKGDDSTITTKKILDFRGKTSLSQLAAIFKTSNLVIGCDTGAMHLSRAVGTKTIVIYGPEDPQITVSSNNLIKIYPELELNCKNQNDYFGISFQNIKRCKLKECRSMLCHKNISPQKVFKIVKKSLE